VAHLPYKPGATPGFYERLRSEPGSPLLSWLVRAGPSWLNRRFLDVTIWQWAGLLVSLGLGVWIMLFCFRLGRKARRRGPRSGVPGYLFSVVFPVAAMLLPLGLKVYTSEALALSGPVLAITHFALNVAFMLAAVVVVIRVGHRLVELIACSKRVEATNLDPLIIRLVGRLVTIAVSVIVFIEGCKGLGIPMTTLLAGAGVGGLALAFGAQDAIKNLVGSMMILLDKPYRVGERIVAKGYDGAVVDIGLRSTRIALFTGSEVSIPNEEMASTHIENVGRRPFIRHMIELPLALNSPAEDIRRAVEIAKDVLQDHEGMKPDMPPRAFAENFTRDAVLVRVAAWYHPPDYWPYTEWAHRTTTGILEALAEANIRLAVPASQVELTSTCPRQGKEHRE
jgi:MscS family membrane protein